MTRIRQFLKRFGTRTRRFLQWLSMTVPGLLTRLDDDRSAMMQTNMGGTVLLVGLFAVFSGGYALYITFENAALASALAVPYALLIVLIDRQIVGAISRWTALPRIALALAIGLAVAIPVELKFFEDAIETRLEAEVTSYNQSLRDSLRAARGLPGLSARIEKLRSARRRAVREAREAARKAQCEAAGSDLPGCTGREGTGPAYEAARRRERAARLRRRAGSLSQRRARLQERVRQRFEAQRETAGGGLLTRFRVLGRIKKESPSAWGMAWGIRIFFVLLELAPTLVKTIRRKTPYERVLPQRQDALSRVEQTKIATEANKKIVSEKKQDPTVGNDPAGTGGPKQVRRVVKPRANGQPGQQAGNFQQNGRP